MWLASKLFIAVAWLPLALLLWLRFSVSRAEGWGAWAIAGSAFPVVLSISAGMTLVGSALWILERRRRVRCWQLLLAAVLAAVPCLWFGLRQLLR